MPGKKAAHEPSETSLMAEKRVRHSAAQTSLDEKSAIELLEAAVRAAQDELHAMAERHDPDATKEFVLKASEIRRLGEALVQAVNEAETRHGTA